MGVYRRRARGADLISGLGDDVLVRILERLPDAGDAVRTGELSRRWRGLWTRAASLTFASGSSPRFKRASGAKRFLAMVSSALAQRAMADQDAVVLEHLTISFLMAPAGAGQQTKHLASQSSQAAHEWILYALQSAVTSFHLQLGLPMTMSNKQEEDDRPMINLSNLPSSANLQSLHWKLDGVGVQLPATAAFTSLEDLSLEDFDIAVGNLVQFLSSACCPRLQKLRLRKLGIANKLGTNVLEVEASALLELSCEEIKGAWVLVLKTPCLRVLHLMDCRGYLKTLRISAPKLEELTFLYGLSMDMFIDGDELPCVRSLKTELQSHAEPYVSDGEEIEQYGYYKDINFSCICLLRYCTSLTSLELSLVVIETGKRLSDIISGKIPHLTHLISLTVHVCLSELHSFGVGLADILAQSSDLKYLRVHCSVNRMSREHDYLCDHMGHWKFLEIHLPDIEEVEITGLAGTECELWFMRQVLARTTHLQKATLCLSPMCRLAEEDDKYFRSSEIIPGGGGTWICHDPCLSYEWKPDP